MAASELILDGCCVLTLAASLQFEEILRDLPYSFHVGERARREAMRFRVEGTESPVPVDLQPLIDAGWLRDEKLETPEESTLFVELAARIDDGESEAAALAINRGWALATDDRKTRRLLSNRPNAPTLRGTLDLFEEWQRAGSIADDDMSEVLRRVRYGARFVPPRGSPLAGWWDGLVGA